jgi:homocysteine S-methyltransferase
MLKRLNPFDLGSTDDLLLTDGGLETTLVFHDGIELPHFAAFPLLETEDGRRALRRYYEKYLELAAERGLGFLLATPTWRANPDWAERLGYDAARLAELNRQSVEMLRDLAADWSDRVPRIMIDGVVGPRGDGYLQGDMDAAAAEAYHAQQVEAFAASGADLVSAITMNTVGEAIGIARAAKAQRLPHVISFTVETDGRLVGGSTLREAIERTDQATGASPAWYMVNCAHPAHFAQALAQDEAWTYRIGGLRPNASQLSHAELDEATTLDDGNPADLAQRFRALRNAFPAIRVLGGCCGTDHRHIEAICEACVTEPA